MFDPSNDFETIIDGLTAAQLLHRGSSQSTTISVFGRNAPATRDLELANGLVVATDRVWHLVLPANATLPKLGDVILDADERRWTILAIFAKNSGTHFRCECRDLQLAFGLGDSVDIQKAIWNEEDPPSVVGWQLLAAGVAARIQPSETTVTTIEATATSEHRFKIYLAEDWPLDHNHRILGPDGSIYCVESYEQSQRLDVLPFASVLLQ